MRRAGGWSRCSRAARRCSPSRPSACFRSPSSAWACSPGCSPAWRAAREGFALGFAWGFGAFAAGVSWLYIALERYGGVPAPVAALAIALFCAYLALYPALAGAAFAALRGRGVACAAGARGGALRCALAGFRMAARRALHRLPLARHRLCADPAQPARRPAAGGRRVWRRRAERLRRRAVRHRAAGARRARLARVAHGAGAGSRPSSPASRCSVTRGPSRPVRR